MRHLRHNICVLNRPPPRRRRVQLVVPEKTPKTQCRVKDGTFLFQKKNKRSQIQQYFYNDPYNLSINSYF